MTITRNDEPCDMCLHIISPNFEIQNLHKSLCSIFIPPFQRIKYLV